MATELILKEKTLPHNAEAERTVLGAVLVDGTAFNSAAEILNRDDFYREGHRKIFDAMAALAERSATIDLVTVKDELVKSAALEAVGGAAYVASLTDGMPRIVNVEAWSRIIRTIRAMVLSIPGRCQVALPHLKFEDFETFRAVVRAVLTDAATIMPDSAPLPDGPDAPRGRGRPPGPSTSLRP